ncbi:hypothetical protein DSM112329_02970 [Paraconexibacter sp. AEG42_29]|uniref:Uncharacterized protein n=2 Tax=Paraconexibacter sp. AEG42_29 TaxID=2997339 RepID=A0AAU7AWT5_9ACTN
MSLRVSPTYVLDDPLENFIVGRDLVSQALNGQWQKAETHRLGYENSEDAVSWNVFRLLQEAGLLTAVASALTEESFTVEPDLILWGHRVTQNAAHDVPELQVALDTLEHGYAQQTEPDVILRVPGWGWVFIEAKLASPSPKVEKHKFDSWVKRYIDPSPTVFDKEAVLAAGHANVHGQLARNVAVASSALIGGERAVVVALVRKKDMPKVDGWGASIVVSHGPVTTSSASWEDFYVLAQAAAEPPSSLLEFMRGKSVGLRQAFDVGQ